MTTMAASDDAAPRRETLFLYMATNRKEGVQSVTRIGCVGDPFERLRTLNSPTPTPGSDRRARQAAGHWNLLLLIAVPPELSGVALKEEWRKSKRKIHKRFEHGIERIARHHRLPYFVDVDELEKDRRIVDELPELVAELRRQVIETACDPRQLAEHLSDGRLPIRLRSADGLSFAHTDRPRERYRKRSASSAAAASKQRRVDDDDDDGDAGSPGADRHFAVDDVSRIMTEALVGGNV